MQIGKDRLPFFDILRGFALVAMTIYHFAWDLEFYGWLLTGTTAQTGWTVFARSIAFSFLFLVGVSLVLAHSHSIRWPMFCKRFLQIAISAFAITVATYLALAQNFIFFGILHAIAVFSVLAVAFIRTSWIFSAIGAVAVFLIWQTTKADIFSHPALLWVGLSPNAPSSNDYVPVFPWFAATLAGIAFTKIASRFGILTSIGTISIPAIASKPLTFIGRHSLVYYLLHQPVMLAALWLFTTVAGPPDRTANFVHLCTKQCSETREELFCRPYCGCVANGMKREAIFEPFHKGEIDIATDATAQTLIRQCTVSSENR